eukprot:scaffold12257_cov141-Isochrysis_galbana.AAC.8
MPCTHERYLQAVDQCRSVDDAVALALDGALGLSYEALLSICSQRLVAETKATMGRHRSAEAAAGYVRRFLGGQTLCSISKDVGLPPTMLARVVLEEHLGEQLLQCCDANVSEFVCARHQLPALVRPPQRRQGKGRCRCAAEEPIGARGSALETRGAGGCRGGRGVRSGSRRLAPDGWSRVRDGAAAGA